MKDKEMFDESANLRDAIIEGVRRKKGHGLVDLDLRELNSAECDHYIICEGTSSTQVEAIARSVEETVEEIAGESVLHSDGYRNAQWILLDYSNIMVHVFQKEVRTHYDIEALWADAQVTEYNDEVSLN